MADTKISALAAAGALTGTELLVCVQGGTDKKCTAQDVADIAAGTGPHWVTTVGGYLEWRSVTNGGQFFRFDDSGTLTGSVFTGCSITYGDPVQLWLVQQTWTAQRYDIMCSNQARIRFGVTAGGYNDIDSFVNAYVETGWTSTSRIYITGAGPGVWGGPGAPVDVETALDRIATAVAGLLGGPIP